MSPIRRLRRRAVVGSAALLVAAALAPVFAAPAGATSADVDGPMMVDTSTGLWYGLDPLGGLLTFYYGDPGDSPFVGDWDCDGVETPGLYRPSDGFAYLRNSNTQGIADIEFFFGNPDDVPLSGDFDGDGCDTLSLYRPSTSEVFIINELGEDGGGLGAAEFSFVFGNPFDTPFVGDFDGDGIDTVGLHRTSTGQVYFRNSLTTGNADFDYFLGNPDDVVVAADWDGDGDDTLGAFRPSTMQFFYRDTNTPGSAEVTQHFWDAARRVRERLQSGGAPTGLTAVAGDLGLTGAVPFTAYACSELDGSTGPEGIVATSPEPSEPSTADAVYGISYLESPACERTIITLGEGFGDTTPANTVPEGMVIENFGHRVQVRLPGIPWPNAEFGPDHITGIDFLGGPNAFVVRAGETYVDVHYASNRFTEAFFLSDPARIVIDTTNAPTGTGIALGPNIGPFAVVRDNLDPDLISPGITAPFEILGYGLFFEATGVVQLREKADVPGTGPLATATFSGSFLGTVTGSDYVIGASTSPFPWGEFSFMIDAIAPGEYELFIDSDSGQGPEDPPGPVTGVYDEFLIVP